MTIKASVKNRLGEHHVTVETNGVSHTLPLVPKAGAPGSRTNGGELLFAALATCYCNDVYREAAARGLDVRGVEVTVEGTFGGPGEPARNVTYRAHVKAAGATEEEIRALLIHTDTVAEVQNTLRAGAGVRLEEVVVEVLP